MTTRVSDFLDAACRLSRYSRDEMTGACRDFDLAQWRHRAIYLALIVTRQSTTQVGNVFCREHTSVIWARRRIEREADQPETRKALARLAFVAAEIAATRKAKQSERISA